MTQQSSDFDQTPDEMRDAILDAVLAHVAFDGWTEAAIKRAADDLGLSRGFIDLAFPGGPLELVEAFSNRADARLGLVLTAERLEPLKIRDRIALAVRTRIESNAAHREAARRALTFLALPQNAAKATTMLWRTADAIWRAVGDKSTDYNYYTKRSILSAVFSTTVLYWLTDESEDHAETWAFLDRRISDVLTFEKAKAKLSRIGDSGKDLIRALGKLRYGT